MRIACKARLQALVQALQVPEIEKEQVVIRGPAVRRRDPSVPQESSADGKSNGPFCVR